MHYDARYIKTTLTVACIIHANKSLFYVKQGNYCYFTTIIVSHVNTPLGCYFQVLYYNFRMTFFLHLVARGRNGRWEGCRLVVEGVAGCVRPSGRTDAAVSWRHPGVYPTHHSVVYRPLYALCTSHYASLVPSHRGRKSNDAAAIRRDCGGDW